MILASMIVIPLGILRCSLSCIYVWFFMFAYAFCPIWSYVIWLCTSTSTLLYFHIYNYIHLLSRKLTIFLFTPFLLCFCRFLYSQFLINWGWTMTHITTWLAFWAHLYLHICVYVCEVYVYAMRCELFKFWIYFWMRYRYYYMIIVEVRGQFYIFVN